MPTIKLRVWDIHNDEMVFNVGYTPEGVPYTFPEHGKFAHDFDNFNYYPDCPIMQYTGVNGMYESDIVSLQTRYGMDSGVVVLKDGCFMVHWVSEKKFPSKANIESFYHLNSKNKVLGNIYENPELL